MARETKAEREARELKEAAKEAANKPLVVDFSDDTKALLRALIEALNNKPAPVINVPGNVPKMENPPAPPTKRPVKQPDLFPEEQVGKPIVSLTQIRELINSKAGEGKTASIVSLLKKHGAQNASSLEESKYDVFYNNLKEI